MYKPAAGALHSNMETIKPDHYVMLVQQHNPSVCEVLDDMKLAARLVRETNVPYVIHREWEGNGKFNAPNDEMAVHDVVNYARSKYNYFKWQLDQHQTRDIHIQVFCEQGFSQNMMLLMRLFMEWSHADGEDGPGFVFHNTNLGAPQHGYWVDPDDGFKYHHDHNWWARGEQLRYLLDLHELREERVPRGGYKFSHGSHDAYGDGLPHLHINAGAHAVAGAQRSWLERDDWVIQWDVPQDYYLRFIQAAYHALGWRWRDGAWDDSAAIRDVRGKPVKPPWVIFTEGGIDDCKIIQRVHKDLVLKAPWTNTQGWNCYYETWAQETWFEGLHPATVYGLMQNWKWKYVYLPTGLCLGEVPYKIGNTNSRIPGQGFTSHNLMGREPLQLQIKFWQAMVEMPMPDHFFSKASTPPEPQPEPEPPAPEPPVVIEPPAPDQETETLLVDVTRLNVRVAPSLSAPIVDTRSQGQQLILLLGTTIKDGYWWRQLITGGWVAERSVTTDDVFLVEIPPPTPEPEPDPEPEYITRADLEAAMTSMIDTLQAVMTAAIKQQASDIVAALRIAADTIELGMAENDQTL